MRKSLLSIVAFLLHVVYAEEWMLGTPVALYLTNETDCPDTRGNIDSSAYFEVLATANSVTVGPGIIVGPKSSISDTFYITEGWYIIGVSSGGDFRTNIQLAKPYATGGGCFSLGKDKNGDMLLGVSPCWELYEQKFYVQADFQTDSGPYQILDTAFQALTQGRSNKITTADAPQTRGFCIYNGTGGNIITVPSIPAQVNVPSYEITNLTGAVTPTNATADIDLPGCIIQNDIVLQTTDCAVSRTVATLPDDCVNDMNSRDCVLHSFTAFCGDIPEIRFGLDEPAPNAVKECLNKVRYGPCVANPSGAACVSGQFGHVTYNESLPTNGNYGPLFGDYNDDIPGEDEFWIGVGENLANAAGAIANLASAADQEANLVGCLISAYWADFFSGNSGQPTAAGCTSIVASASHVIPPIKPDNELERAGSTFADVVAFLIPIADIAKAVSSLEIVVELVGKLTSRAATASDLVTTGLVMEATGPSGDIVKIYKDIGYDGLATPFQSEDEVNLMKQTIEETAFETCQKCLGAGTKRRRGPKTKRIDTADLCCFVDLNVNPSYDDVVISLGDMESPPRIPLSDVEIDLRTQMSTMFDESFVNKLRIDPVCDPITLDWHTKLTNAGNAVDEGQALVAVRDSWAKTFRLSKLDLQALEDWTAYYEIDLDELQYCFGKLPAATDTIVARNCNLNTEDVNMLINAAQGLRSRGEPGIYEIQDLVVNVRSKLKPNGEYPREVMASSLLGPGKVWKASANYKFVIKSSTARYISPAYPKVEDEAELVFLDGIAGKFKLLGYQPLNGGEAARAVYSKGPYGVFYFIEQP